MAAARPTRLRKAILVVGLTVFTTWTVFPLLWMIQISLKPDVEIYGTPAIVPHSVTLTQYASLFTTTNFVDYFLNSLKVSVLTTICAMVVGVLAAYAISRLKFGGRTVMANIAVTTYLVPASLLFIPLFQVAAALRLTDKTLGLVPIYLIFSVPFCTWLCIAHMESIPKELEEASYIDGCSKFQSLLRIMLPLLGPALAVVALFAFTNAWNEFLYALILITTDTSQTIPVGLSRFVIGDVYVWGPLMAAAVLATAVPVLIYLLAQRWVVAGLTAGATKG